MTRLRPGGSFSRRKLSPWWNRMGGVERSTSRTKPGRRGASRRSEAVNLRAPPGVCAAARSSIALSFGTEVEGDLDRATGAGLGGMRDGVGGAGQGIGVRDE